MDRRGVQEGMKVRSSDGESLGKVVACGDETFLIEKGFFFPKDYTARYGQVEDIREGEIWLTESGQQLTAGLSAGVSEGMSTGVTEEVRVPLAEEELTAEKRTEKAGEVRVRKDVVTEQKQVTVPVTREEVRVERVPASGEARAGETAFQEGSINVPVYEEEVELRKRPVVREEVRVAKTAHEEEQRLGAETRKETAEIEQEGEKRSYGMPEGEPYKRS